MFTKYYSTVLIVFFCFQLGAYSQDESFESASVPSYWTTTNGNLSISTDRYKHGVQSLQWNWNSNAVITVSNLQSHGLTASQIADYFYHFFRMWVYNTSAIPAGELQIEFYDNTGTKQYYYSFGINFTGWRAATSDYTNEMSGNKSSTNITSMKIKAPASGSGTLFFDFIDFTMPRITERAKDYQLPFINNIAGDMHWLEMMYYQSLPKTIPATTPTAQELADFTTVKQQYDTMIKGSAPSSTNLNTAVTQYNDANITYSNGIIKGNPLYGKDNPDTENLQVVENFIHVFARDYKNNTATASTSKEYFLNSVRYLLDQGYADGSLMETVHHIGYSFIKIPMAIHLMKDELITAGLWDQAQKMVEWYSAVDGIWSPDASSSNMDDGNTRTIARLGACLYKTTDTEKVQYLKGFKQYVETFLTLYAKEEEGLKVDYTGFHHNIFYPGYSFASNNNLAQAIGYISQGVYAINDNARNNLKKSLLLSRVISEGGQIPNSLSGRNPFVTPSFKNGLKYLGLTNPVDADLLKAHNYTYGSDSQTTSYGTETPPTGFWQVNFANLGSYRQSNWVADIKGFNKYFYGTEIYSSENRYGRYQSYGAIEILYPGGHTNSLLNINGWDWNKTPGATTKHLTDANLIAAVGRQDETTSSNFAASLRFGTKNNYYIDQKIEGNYGIFGMDFVQSALSSTHDANFKFKKSVFCFDGKLICLGSNISSSNGLIATNLFQNYLSSTSTTINADNTYIATFPYNTTLNSTSNHWIIDAAGTGYFIKSGNSIVIDRKSQSSPKETGDGTFTTGNFASAYISHGTAPSNVGYEYVIIPQSTSTDIDTFSTNMNSSGTAFYQVVQKDATAHIVKYNNMYGYSLFSAGSYGTSTLIKSNSTHCLVMTKQTNDSVDLSFVNPDLNFDVNGTSQTVSTILTLNGNWTINSSNGGTATANSSNGITTLTIGAKDGLAVDIQLTKGANPFTPIFFYEDFRYEAGLNGFIPKVIVNNSGQLSTTVITRVSDVPDATDSSPIFNTTDRPANRIPQYAANDQRAIKITGTSSNINYAIDAYTVFTTLDITANNPLISISDTRKYATFWTKRIGGNGDIANITMLVSTNYTGDPTTTTWTSLPIVAGKIATTSDNSKYVKGVVDLTPFADGSDGTTVTLALRYQGSSSTYSATNSNGTFLFSDLQFIGQPTTYITTIWNGSTWSNGVPNNTTDAIIAGNYNENTAITANNLTINNNAIVTIPSGNNVTLSGALTVSSGSFILENNAKLIQTTNTANTGAITIKRNSAPMVRLDYTLWSSPVATQNLFNFSPLTVTTPTPRFYSYETGANSYSNTGITSTSTFATGKGYAVRAPNNYNVNPTVFNGTFTGVPNNGTYTIALDNSGQGFNLVGNPYPSPIDAAAFVAGNSIINGTLYFYSHNAKSDGANYETSTGGNGMLYATWNSTGGTVAASGVSGIGQNTSTPNGTIQIGQGFIVKATNTGNLNFTNAMRTVTGTAANADQFFKVNNNTIGSKSAEAAIATEKHRLWLDLTNEKGEGLSQLLVGYVDGATNEVDNLFDGEEFGNPQSSLSSQLNGKSYTIQGRALPFNDSDVVPLAFKAAANGKYTISLSKTDGLFASNQEVLFKDNATGTVKDLKTGPYTFNATAGTNNTRFELAYSKSAINAIEGATAVVTAVKKQGVYQISTDGGLLKEIVVYDIQGREILKQKEINAATATLNGLTATRGVLILKVTTENNTINTIKIIN